MNIHDRAIQCMNKKKGNRKLKKQENILKCGKEKKIKMYYSFFYQIHSREWIPWEYDLEIQSYFCVLDRYGIHSTANITYDRKSIKV